MSRIDLKNEVNFGLENLHKVFESINYISSLQSTLNAILELMAFRHVATKIYGFLIDRDKLEVVADRIKREHNNISNLITQVSDAILNKAQPNDRHFAL